MLDSPWLKGGLIIFTATVLVPILWCFVMWITSRASGWNRLAKRYESNRAFHGKRHSRQIGQLGWVGYNGVLTFTATNHGLGINVMALFSAGHPPLLIPWTDLYPQGTKRRFLKDYEVYHIGQPVEARLALPAGIVRNQPPTSES